MKPTANTRFKKDFPLWSGKIKRSQFLFNTVLEILTSAIMYRKEIKDIQTGKQEVKLYPFTENMILYIETTKKNPPKKLRYKKIQQRYRIQD